MDVLQSSIVKFYFEAANSIDNNNDYHQYLLRLEEIWQTIGLVGVYILGDDSC